MHKIKEAMLIGLALGAFLVPAMVSAQKTRSGFSLAGLFAEGGNCTAEDTCLRLLWPADPQHPGKEMLELQGSLKPVSEQTTPVGPAKARLLQWRLPSGEKVAETRVLQLSEDRAGRAWVLETEIKQEISGATGDFNRPAFAAPGLSAPAALSRVLTFQMAAFAPPVRQPVPTSGPVVLYNDQLAALVFSPLDHFLASISAPQNGEWLSGFEGEVGRIPAGTVHRVLIVEGHGINSTLIKWGELVQAWYQHARPSAYADVGLRYLGYWTDNGAFYYYHTAPGLNYHQTLIAVRDDAKRRGIPFGYFQLDSWWYPKAKAKTGLLAAARGGSIVWEPIPELFPQGLPAFQQELHLPLVAHNRWYDVNSPYCRRYQCVTGEGGRNAALPIDPDFWNEIMDNAVKYGVKVYEQDWLDTQLDMIPWLRSELGHAETWFDTMVKTANSHGLTMQLCMASPGFFLEQVKFPNVTTVRASGDYMAGLPKTWFWPNFHQVSVFAYAVGLWPFKDNFQSASGQRAIRNERYPYEEALIAILSAGMVGPSDKIGAADKDLLMRTCRPDGVLLKPDRPAFPIDLMYLDSRKPWIVSTESEHEIGKTIYLAAFNLWPARMHDPGISFEELGLTGNYAVYNYRTGELELDRKRTEFGRMPKNQACYYILCPVLANGLAIIGETDKFITLSKKRFPSIREENGILKLEIEGVPGEEVKVAFSSPRPPRQVQGGELLQSGRPTSGIFTIIVKIPDSGRTSVEMQL